MCGLAGVCGTDIYATDLQAFRQLLYVTNLRGGHGTGVASIDIGDEMYAEKITLLKSEKNAERFLEETKEDRDAWSMWNTIFMGHCRYATVGAVNSDNAHPFRTKGIIGAHNGSLWETRFNPKDSPKTDSELMMEEMAEKGIAPVLDTLSYNSAFAVTIYEEEGRKLVFARNHRRPLFVARHTTRRIIFWASELRMLELILARNEDQFSHKKLIDCCEIEEFAPYKVYTLELDDIRLPREGGTFLVDELEDKRSKATTYYGFDDGFYSSMYEDLYNQDPKTDQTLVVPKKSAEVSAQVFEDAAKGPRDERIEMTQEELELARARWRGEDVECSHCDAILEPHEIEASKVEHAGGTSYICEGCQDILSMPSQGRKADAASLLSDRKVDTAMIVLNS